MTLYSLLAIINHQGSLCFIRLSTSSVVLLNRTVKMGMRPVPEVSAAKVFKVGHTHKKR